MVFGLSCLVKSCFPILILYLLEFSKWLVITSLKGTFTVSYFTKDIEIVLLRGKHIS